MATDRNRNPALPDLSSSLQGLFTRKNWGTLWQTYTLVQKWPEIVGKNIAQKSEPAYIQKNTLWVYVENSVLMQHMQPQKLTLIEKINSIVPDADIQDIRWAMQPAKPIDEPTEPARKNLRKMDPEERDDFDAIAQTVENEQCRDALKKLWRTYHNR